MRAYFITEVGVGVKTLNLNVFPGGVLERWHVCQHVVDLIQIHSRCCPVVSIHRDAGSLGLRGNPHPRHSLMNEPQSGTPAYYSTSFIRLIRGIRRTIGHSTANRPSLRTSLDGSKGYIHHSHPSRSECLFACSFWSAFKIVFAYPRTYSL